MAFTIYNCMGTDWVRSKPIMGVVGLLITILAAFASFGIIMYFKWEWQVHSWSTTINYTQKTPECK